MKVYTKRDKFWGVLRTDSPPKGIIACFKVMAVVYYIIAVVALISLGYTNRGLSVLVALLIAGLATLLLHVSKRGYRVWEQFCSEMQQKEKEEEERSRAYRKANEDELLYNECAKHGISTLDAAGMARMKIIAKEMDIVCSDDELVNKYKKGQAIAEEKARKTAEKEKKERVFVLRKEERAVESTCKKYIHLFGTDKRIKQCEDELVKARERVTNCEAEWNSILNGSEALYSLQAKEEKDWAVHGGIASAIAGGAAGVATAMDIQLKNAEARAANAQLRQATNQLVQPALMANLDKKISAQDYVETIEKELDQAKYKLVEELPQDELLAMLSPEIDETKTSETGAITFTVSYKSTGLTIYETVRAVVDGSFKVKIMDGDNLAGEAYFSLPFRGSYLGGKITSICASLPEEPKDYTFEFAPHKLFAIER